MLCNKCNVELNETNKFKDKNSCKECENKRRRENINKKKEEFKEKLCDVCVSKKIEEYCEKCKEIYSKKCSSCQEIKLLNQFISIKHKKCKACSPKQQNATKSEWLENHPDIKTKQCNLCNETKDLSRFSYHTNNFRNQCKDCLNGKKYYEKSRKKKRAENEKEFIAHNTKVSREWKNKNKERYKQYYTAYNKTLKRHVTNAINKAKKKQEITDENNKELYDLFENLMLLDCAYCGVNESINEIYNGVDRIDSIKCYTAENSTPCCEACNMIKNTIDVESFLRKCVEISMYNKLNEIKKDDYRLKFHENILFTKNTIRSYNGYKGDAKRRNIHFDLTSEQFSHILNNDCYLCGNSAENQSCGIDRVDNNVGYIIENCKSCCKYCNYMKRDSVLNEFLEHIKQIVDYTTENENFKDKTYTFCDILQKTKHHFE